MNEREFLDDLSLKMLASVEHLSSELSSMRTNRAHAGLVSGINIDYFGSTMKLSELGQISVSDGTMILIQLWDKSAVEMVSKEIESSDIGINPSIDGDTIRLVVPPLNEERRLELVKIVKKKSEDAKISIRNVRRSAMDEVKDLEKKGELSQDESRRMQSDIQKNTDESIEEISQIAQNKENELMEVWKILENYSSEILKDKILKIFDSSNLSMPNHVGIIMDGNRRWAAENRKPVFFGHKEGTRNLEALIDFSIKIGIKYLTIFTFSTENWERPKLEVNYITKTLLNESLNENFDNLHKLGVKIVIRGSIEKLDKSLKSKIINAQKKTLNNKSISLVIAFDYGGRNEIVNTVKDIVKDDIKFSEINEELFNKYINKDEIPDPDLIIRTGGEYRLSNFLIWQSAYSEFYTSEVLWPDFTMSDFFDALESYSLRSRRFGTN